MSLIETIRNKPEKTRQRIIAGISAFLVLVIVLIGWLIYESPYPQREMRQSTIHPPKTPRIRDFLSNSQKSADSFVEPVNQLFIQQNGDFSSEN